MSVHQHVEVLNEPCQYKCIELLVLAADDVARRGAAKYLVWKTLRVLE